MVQNLVLAPKDTDSSIHTPTPTPVAAPILLAHSSLPDNSLWAPNEKASEILRENDCFLKALGGFPQHILSALRMPVTAFPEIFSR